MRERLETEAGLRGDANAPRTTHRFIHYVRTERPPATEFAAEARERLRELFPRTALRRMTHLGMLVGSTLKDLTLRPDDALVYASSYAETRAMEDFLTSFPATSPLLFQTSIHPGGVQQVLIGRQQPVARLWPLAGRSRIVEQALTIALCESAPRVILTGGEERGTWLLQEGVASDEAFAFALALSPEPAGALGVVWFCQADSAHSAGKSGECPTLSAWVAALAERRPLEWSGTRGRWSVNWTA